MPSLSQVLGGVLQNAIQHPKTTIQSILTAAMFGGASLLACGCISNKVLAVVGTVLAVAKVGLGMLQTDGVVLPPGTTATSDTQTKIVTPKVIQ